MDMVRRRAHENKHMQKLRKGDPLDPHPLRPFNAVRHSAGKLPHKARRQHKAGNTCRGRDKLRNSGRSGRGSGLGLCATLEHLQRAGLVQKEVIMAKNRKRRRRQPPPLWQRRTCDTCASQKRCDDFFERAYARMGMKEPESWRKWACKMYKEKEDKRK